MIAKIYRYRVDPAKKEEFLEIQKDADDIYSKHIDYLIQHLQSESDPWEWVEIHQYKNNADEKLADGLGEKEPKLMLLYNQFLTVLDPQNNEIKQELFSDSSIR